METKTGPGLLINKKCNDINKRSYILNRKRNSAVLIIPYDMKNKVFVSFL